MVYDILGFTRPGRNAYEESAGETVPDELQADLTLEKVGREELLAAITAFAEWNHLVSRDKLRDILFYTEAYIDFLKRS